ncbi:MAG: hypothetical protein QW222_07205 [Candidatus Bathyarchaeia archaeon]
MKSFKAFRLLPLTLLCILSITITVYTITAYSIAHYVYEEGDNAYWRYTPPGTFLPWPKPPGILTALSKISEIDLFIYRYLLKTWLMIIITILFWAVTCIYILKRWSILKTFEET